MDNTKFKNLGKKVEEMRKFNPTNLPMEMVKNQVVKNVPVVQAQKNVNNVKKKVKSLLFV